MTYQNKRDEIFKELTDKLNGKDSSMGTGRDRYINDFDDGKHFKQAKQAIDSLVAEEVRKKLESLLTQREPVISDDDPDEDIRFEAVPEQIIKNCIAELQSQTEGDK